MPSPASNENKNSSNCPLYSSLHSFLMTSSTACIPQPRRIKTAPSLESTVWSAGSTLPTHGGWRQGVQRWPGPGAERRAPGRAAWPSPQTPAWRSVLLFLSPLFCQETPRGAAGPGGQEAVRPLQGRQVPRWQREGTEARAPSETAD